MANVLKFEFDCPQYVDFENVDNDSQAELFFETVHDHSPRLSAYSRFGASKPKLSTAQFLVTPKEADTTEVLEFPVCDGPFRNTRLAQEKNRSSNDQQRYSLRATAFRTLSTNSQPNGNELPSKKAKLELSQNPFKQPLARKQKHYASHTEISSRRKELSRRSNLENRLPTTSKGTGADTSMSRTVPVPFSFQTDKRVKSGTTSSVEYKPLDFIASLRSNRAAANSQAKIPSGPVRAVSERLLRKRKYEGDCKTLGEKVLSFEQGLSNRTKNVTPDGKKVNRSLHVTQPVTPHFRAAARSRPLNILSHEQKEILEAEEIRKYQFKARPMDPRIFVPFGLKARQTGENLKVVPMSLETGRRALLKPRTRSLDREMPEPRPEFHARPVPRKILRGITGLGERVVPKPTEAHTPPFMLKEREECWKVNQTKQKEAEEEAAAKAAVQFKKPRRTRSHDSLLLVAGAKEPPKKTLPAPFSFHERDQTMLAKKEEKIKQIIQEEKKLHEFQAHPMPSPSVSGIPQRITAPATVIESFSMEADEKGRNRASKWQKNMEEEMELQKKMIMFKAQPCTVTIKEPFKVAKSKKPPTEISEFSLYTESRLADRVKYDEQLLQKEKEKQEILERRRLEEEVLAQKEIAEMRAKAVHKANPVPEYRPLEVKRQLIPVTKAVTPKFETDQRLRARKDE